ncbi:MAG: U32 family peptidase, partial [Oscillospiraceae bacterium]
VVLAREMSKEEIKSINDNVEIETEVFVHGALCYCMSGQCYISSIIGERSGNRGLCAQSCRLPFEIAGTDVKNALSLKDLSLIKHLKELEEIGVTSFKIEGRMKRPEYVYMATKQAGSAVDGKEVDYEGLRSVFSRSGFTDGYYENKINSDMFGTRQKEDVVDMTKVLKTLQNQLIKENPCIDIDYKFTLKNEQPSKLTVSDGKNSVTVTGDMPEIAQNKPTDEEMVKKSLLKVGGTYFNVRNIDIELDGGICMPVSKINELRRNAFEILMEKREEIIPHSINEYQIPQPENTRILKKPVFRAEFFRGNQISRDDISFFERIYLPINEIQTALDIFGEDIRQKLWAVMPRICFGNDKQKLEKDLQEIKSLGIKGIKSSNVGLIYLGKSLGFEVCGGFGLNITNSLALAKYKEIGLCDAVLSFELNLKDAKSIESCIPCGIIAYGYLPVMVTRNCPIKAFKGCGNCD